MRELTTKEECFALNWHLTGNKSEAYRIAYNSENMKPETINNKAYLLSKKGEIRERFNELQKELAESVGLTKAMVLKELSILAFSDLTDLMVSDVRKLPPEVRRAIKKVKRKEVYNKDDESVDTIIELEGYDKRGALESINKMLGWNQQEEEAIKEPPSAIEVIIVDKREQVEQFRKTGQIEPVQEVELPVENQAQATEYEVDLG